MTDFVCRAILRDLVPVVTYISNNLASLVSGSDDFLASYTILQAKDDTYVKTAAMVLSDANGNVAIFAVDAGDITSSDDGVNVIALIKALLRFVKRLVITK